MGSHKNNFAKGTKPGADASGERGPLKKSLAGPASHTDPSGSPVSFSKLRAAAVALQRCYILRRFQALQKDHTNTAAAVMLGVSINTLWRWRKAHARRGLAGLMPRTSNCGRRSPFRFIRLTAQAVRELELLHAENSSRQAWRKFAASAHCPPLVALCVRQMDRPPSLLAGIGRVWPVAARCGISTDGRRLFVKLPARTTITIRLAVPANLKLQRGMK